MKTFAVPGPVFRPLSYAILMLCTFCYGHVRGDVLLNWNAALELLAPEPESLPIHGEARVYAMVHLAMEEAATSFFGAARPFSTPAQAQIVAASAAAHAVLLDVSPKRAAGFDALHTQEIAVMPPGPERDRAERIGREAAAVVVQKRSTDGWLDSERAQTGVAALRQPLNFRTGVDGSEPRSPWLAATPFAVKSAKQFAADLPYWLDFDGEPQPYHAIVRSKIFDGVDRSIGPDVLRSFWVQSSVISWNRIVRDVILRSELDFARRARAFATVNVAIADATLAALHWRFVSAGGEPRWKETYYRVANSTSATDTPVTVLLDGYEETVVLRTDRRQIRSAPLLDYPSVTATIASAAAAALSEVADAAKFAVEVPVSAPIGNGLRPATRSFASLTVAARECAYVSSLDGRHSREACVAGYRLGDAIGHYIGRKTRAAR